MSFAQGCSFRATAGYIVDKPTDFFAGTLTGLANYPVTTKQGTTFGWETIINSVGVRDRTTSWDSRLAGQNYVPNDGSSAATFRIDLPKAGYYNIRLAAGDASSAQTITLELFDNASSLGVLINTVTTINPGDFIDATSTTYTTGAWPQKNSSITKLFSSTICRFRLNAVNTSNTNTIAYFYIEDTFLPYNVKTINGTYEQYFLLGGVKTINGIT